MDPRPDHLPDGTLPATARSWDATTGTGSVLLDDGRSAAFGAEAWSRSGLRLLRPGQRVRLSVRGGEVAAVTLATLPDPLGEPGGGA